MSIITNVFGREIIDSRGVPTVEVEITLNNSIVEIASVPSGASTGSFEAHELRDKDKKRFFSRGVLSSVNFINTEIRETIKGIDVREQKTIDNILIDYTKKPIYTSVGCGFILNFNINSFIIEKDQNNWIKNYNIYK